jgi:hypothetical protein
MRVYHAAAVLAILAGPAYAQTQPIQRYGEADKDKSPQQIEADRAAERAYKNSLGNIPDKGPSDPWGSMRSDSPPKAVAKTTVPVKRAKTDSAVK